MWVSWIFAGFLMVNFLPTAISKSKSTITDYYKKYNGAIDIMCCAQNKDLGWSYRKCMVSKGNNVTTYRADELSPPCFYLTNSSNFQQFCYSICTEVDQTKRAYAVHCMVDQILHFMKDNESKTYKTTKDTYNKAQACYNNVYGTLPTSRSQCIFTPFIDVIYPTM